MPMVLRSSSGTAWRSCAEATRATWTSRTPTAAAPFSPATAESSSTTCWAAPWGRSAATGYRPVSLTAFGDTEDKNAFFTGKPLVEGLGYAFLLRSYRLDHGKWLTADPLGYPDGWNNLVYCGNNGISAYDYLGAKVYWCTRDMASIPLGNHHFLTFIPDSPMDFSSIDYATNLGNGDIGWTKGGHKDDNATNANLVTRTNNNYEVMAILEFRDPLNYPPGGLYDWDTEMHEIPTPTGMTDTEFINLLLYEIGRYQNNCPYSLVDENCAAWVNTILKHAGISDELRDSLGEFWGIDWGEEDLIPEQFFE